MARILLINNAEPGIYDFARPIERIIKEFGFTYLFIEYSECQAFDFIEFDGVILTGSPQGDDIVEHHLPYFQWIKDFNKPIFGICAGHHIVGALYGSEILRSVEPESGICEVEIIKDDPILNHLPRIIKVKQMHNDSVTLPGSFELLATSKTCRNQLMKHKNKPLYTSQFHPEFYNSDLIQNFLAICDWSKHSGSNKCK
ncbi:MAG TPA: hypothetical protein VLA03_02675 [Draconibacterium sp.]|nr:hypothetical protein [Draconibacterium sp.]